MWNVEDELIRFDLISEAWKSFFNNKKEFENIIVEDQINDKINDNKLKYTLNFKITEKK